MKTRHLLLVLPLLLAGCGPDKGTIREKVYHEPWVQYYSTCVSYNKYGTCTFSVPNNIPHAAQYCVKLEDSNFEKCMPESTWNSYEVGDHYPRTRTEG